MNPKAIANQKVKSSSFYQTEEEDTIEDNKSAESDESDVRRFLTEENTKYWEYLNKKKYDEHSDPIKSIQILI